MTSLIDPGSTALVWAAMLAIAAFGMWSEKSWLGRSLSGALVTLLAGIAMSNLGMIPAAAPAYGIIYDVLLPLAIPLILFQANLARIAREAGRLLIGFMAGAAGTIAGAVLAFALFSPVGNGAEITAALTAAYIGGTVNLVAVARAVGIEAGDGLAATVAAGNLTVVAYLVGLFLLRHAAPLARWLAIGPADRIAPSAPAGPPAPLGVLPVIGSLAISASVCAAGLAVESRSGLQGSALLTITLLSVVLATSFPAFFARLACAGAVGYALLHVLFAAIGASASIHAVIATGSQIVAFAAVILAVHLVVSLLAAKLFSLSLDEALVASNACALGAPTAAAMAVAFGRNDMVPPALLCGVLGYALGNFAGLAMFGFLQ